MNTTSNFRGKRSASQPGRVTTPVAPTPPRPPAVSVVSLSLADSGTLAARADILIGRGHAALTLREVRLFRDSTGFLIYPPQLVWQDDSGRRCFTDLVKWSKPLRQAILVAVRSAYEVALINRSDSSGEKTQVAGEMAGA